MLTRIASHATVALCTLGRPARVRAHVYNKLGRAFQSAARHEEAIECYRAALRLRSRSVDAYAGLAGSLFRRGDYDESIEAYRTALQIAPSLASLHNDLGLVHLECGELDAAIDCFRIASETWGPGADPATKRVAHRNLIRALQYHPDTDSAQLRYECRRWVERYAAHARGGRRHCNDRTIGRRLRVGYVLPPFDRRGTACFIAPFLEKHDRRAFEVYCYASVRARNDVTERLRASARVWRDVGALSDEALGRTIEADGIDILVDLSMHTSDDRLMTLAGKPAPVQITGLGCSGTTGLPSIDYRLTDEHLDVPSGIRFWSSEDPLFVPDGCFCYAPTVAPRPPVPAHRSGPVVFGNLNDIWVLNDGSLALHADVLQAVPESRLLMTCPAGAARERVRRAFSRRGVAPHRLDLGDRLSTTDDLRKYEGLDVGLDIFPGSGITTMCDAMYMGVPVVTLPGARPSSRVGASLLNAAGLPQLVAKSPTHYVEIASKLAGDRPRLAALRAGLRSRMEQSSLMDGARFARAVESLYRFAWRRWCAS